jgi:uncharacterized membrane protein YvbJ
MKELHSSFDICPHCGMRVLKGAMRCVGCGRILKTPEEQLTSIKQLERAERTIKIRRIFRFIVLLAALGVMIFFFSEHIVKFINGLFSE